MNYYFEYSKITIAILIKNSYFLYFSYMKQILILTFVFIVVQSINAQFTLRNDFVINGKEHKIRNRGITSISINLDRHQNMNYLINGRGGKTVCIDVDALRHPHKKYSYTEIAEKMDVPNGNTGFRNRSWFTLMTPPVNRNVLLLTFRPSVN